MIHPIKKTNFSYKNYKKMNEKEYSLTTITKHLITKNK
jgi:hypothetical protein